MHLKAGVIVFAAAVFLLLGVAECVWMDHICQHKREIRDLYDNDTVTISRVMEDPDNSTYQYRKFCIYNHDEMMEACMEIGTKSTGESFSDKLRIRRAVGPDDDDTDSLRYSSYKNRWPRRTGRLPGKRGPVKDHSNYSFQLDATSSCRVPENIKTAEIRCKLKPSSITCKSYCVYGTTFKEGIERIHNCVYSENKWSSEFEECKPFVDCHAKLKTPGSLKCVRNEVMESPTCEIWCEMYEDKDETEKQKYACKSNGSWQPPLPFCAELRGGIRLVPSPRVIEHTALVYP